jgi:hypothetical protein
MKVQEHFIVRLGGRDYCDTPNLVVYKGEPLLTLRRADDAELEVEADVFDADGQRKAKVRGTELVEGEPGALEVSSTENCYVIRDRSNDRVVCEIRRRAGQQMMDLDVSVLMHAPDGFLIHANPAQCNVAPLHEELLVRGGEAAIVL